MRRLHLHIYVAFLALGAFCVAVVGAAGWALSPEHGELSPQVRGGLEVLVETLPPEPSDAALQALARRLDLELILWDADGVRIAESAPLEMERPEGGHWVHPHEGPGVAITLADGRTIAAIRRAGFHHGRRFGGFLLLILGVVAVGSYPIARQITRRLEVLRAGVEAWGEGALAERVPVEGRDEVARLARSFNRAAERIEALVEGQRRTLASASHELRSPLARVRLALELLGDDLDSEERDALRADAAGDIEELDALIGDLLEAERARSGAPLREPVDLDALLTEEAARVGAAVRPSGLTASADPRSLRRAARNLLENARRHGGGAAIEAWAEPVEGGVRIVVVDRGPGVPAEARERIFEPFYRPEGHRESADGGVGLGLALVRHVARAHGGEARYVDREGGGSRFEVTLKG
ncbi:MAG: HAMP domain-containing histidine kinase [Alphaproteobacteria bacterium]|nr:HAMP domain-containing histidine kinase [Alphaproteobacteria bacterium]